MKNLKPAIVFILVCAIGALLVFLTDNSCEAISQYTWAIQFGIGKIVFSLAKMATIFTLGMLVLLLIKKWINPEKYDWFKIIYFGLLPLIVFHAQFLLIPKNIINWKIKKSICSKSSTNGMTIESKTINLTEYNYLKNKLALLPDLPTNADSIDLSYYTDNFLGDFSLDISFCCADQEQIDTSDHRWGIIDESRPLNKRINYYDEAN